MGFPYDAIIRVTVVVGEMPCSMTETMMASSTWAWPGDGQRPPMTR